MEDPRLSRMYWALLKQGLARRRHSLWRTAVLRSGLLTVMVLAALVVVLAFGWREHTRGQFAQLKKGLQGAPKIAVAPRPGGQDVVRLQRTQIIGGNGPEFLSATLLPGRGMNLLQISAYVPGKGEVNLLASPSLEEAAAKMRGTGQDANGEESLTMGGAVEVPWAGRISGVPGPEGHGVMTTWHGLRVVLPADAAEETNNGVGSRLVASGGLLLKQPSSYITTNVMPDGGQAQATFEAGSFNGHWPSATEVTDSVSLSGRSIEIRITARNTGAIAEPMGIGWHPRFAILSGHRGQMMLRLPQAERVDVKDRRNEELSGRLLPVAGTEYDFTKRGGAKLGALNLDDTFVHLRRGLMENGPVIELRDPEGGYGLRITALTPAIQAVHVYAPLDGSFLSIAPRFNLDDPFGREWPREEDTGMVVLQPGKSTEWYIRIEIFALNAGSAERL